MEEDGMIQGVDDLATPSCLIVGLAVNGSRKTNDVVRWALDKFVPESMLLFKLICIRPKITRIPTAMGSMLISEVREDVVTAYKKEVVWQTYDKLLPYKNMCHRKKVEVEIVQIESDDVVDAIKHAIVRNNITKLVIGASSKRIIFSRGKNLSSRISESIPSFCAVYTISKGHYLRSGHLIWKPLDPVKMTAEVVIQVLPQILQVLSQGLQVLQQAPEQSGQIKVQLPHTPNPFQIHYQPHVLKHVYLVLQDTLNFEKEKLRVELRHFRQMFALVQNETLDALRRLKDLEKQQHEESVRLKELKAKEEEAKYLAHKEKEQHEAAKRQAEFVRENLRRVTAIRKGAEEKALQESREKQKLQNTITGVSLSYQKFTWEEIVAACSSFSEDLKIGTGGYGTVYKSNFYHMVAAVKVLHSQKAHRTKQFQQELKVLSRIRHPHLLILIGACVDHGCLVYEYMANGSLEDRLFRKNNTPPIPWFDRFRIMWEVASALIFLHNAKPKSIVHSNLKPANILLDQNLVSKIGDFGLSTMLQSTLQADTAVLKDMSPDGTNCHIDPEYQRTRIISPKSDVYALGIVILQLLTARPANVVSYVVESALEVGKLAKVLDPQAGEWPVDETKELAILALSCAELKRNDRPHLKDKVLPVLERLKRVADAAQRTTSMKLLIPGCV